MSVRSQQFIAARIGSDTLKIAELLQEIDEKDTVISQLKSQLVGMQDKLTTALEPKSGPQEVPAK